MYRYVITVSKGQINTCKKFNLEWSTDITISRIKLIQLTNEMNVGKSPKPAYLYITSSAADRSPSMLLTMGSDF